MLNITEIEKEIDRLEHKDYLTYDICEKLAMLYIVKDHYENKHRTNEMSPTAIK